jgi:hypothetical protein
VIASITFSPSTAAGGSPDTGTVAMSAPVDGAAVELVSSNPAVLTVQAETVVPRGGTSATFTITTTAVTANTPVTITATVLGSTTTKSATLTVVPATTPPTTDTVTIQTATWQQSRMRIEAQDSNPNAILGVYLTADGAFLLNLTNNGGGRYSFEGQWLDDPGNITVRSNFGGSASHWM